MYEDLILPLVILLFLAFILIVPSALYWGIRKIKDPIPFWLPLLLAALVFIVMAAILWSGVIAQKAIPAGTLVLFFFLLLLSTFAFITPYLWLGKRTGETPFLAFSILAFFGVALMFYTTMGHSYAGQPHGPLGEKLPLTGWVLDGLASLFSLNEWIYSPDLPVYTIVVALGLYLQMFIISGVFFGVLAPVPAEDEEEHAGK